MRSDMFIKIKFSLIEKSQEAPAIFTVIYKVDFMTLTRMNKFLLYFIPIFTRKLLLDLASLF